MSGTESGKKPSYIYIPIYDDLMDGTGTLRPIKTVCRNARGPSAGGLLEPLKLAVGDSAAADSWEVEFL